MEEELRDLFDLPPTLLYKQDLFDLEKELYSLKDNAQNDFEISLTKENRVITVSSIKELFLVSDLPRITDKLSIYYTLWVKDNDKKI